MTVNKKKVDMHDLLAFFRENIEELSKGNTPGYVIQDVLKDKFMEKMKVDEKQYARLINQAHEELEILSKENGRYYALCPKKKAN